LKEHGKERVKEFEEYMNRSNKVMECFHIAGNYDFIMKVMVKNVEDYQYFVLNELSAIKNISNVHSSFVMGKLKHTLSFDLGN
jgi:DNA-binding Lrp family transcriptional regulator